MTKFWPLHFRDYYSSSTLLLLSTLAVGNSHFNVWFMEVFILYFNVCFRTLLLIYHICGVL